MWKNNHTSLYKEVAGTFFLKWEQKRLCELRKPSESQIKSCRTYLTKVKIPKPPLTHLHEEIVVSYVSFSPI